MLKDTEKMRKTMVALVTIVLLLSIVLCIHSISGYGLIGCYQGSHCNSVLSSKWSFLFGIIPVSALASGVWIVFLLCLIFHSYLQNDCDLQRFLRQIILLLSGVVIGSALWFIWLQYHMIRAFCPYCMTAHLLGVIISLVSVIWCIRLNTARYSVIIPSGFLIAVCVAVFQFQTTPRTLAERGFTQEPLPVVNPYELPVMGDPDAPHVITLLFDWQCSHCRQLHLMLPDVVRNMSGRVAFVCCPVSLSRECNPYVPQGPDSFKGSCALLRTGLALWRTDPIAYYRYEEWYWGDQAKGWNPPSVEDAQMRASELVGDDALERAMNDPWIDNYLNTVLKLFGRTSENGRAAVPRLIYQNNWLIPEADTPESMTLLINSLLDAD